MANIVKRVLLYGTTFVLVPILAAIGISLYSGSKLVTEKKLQELPLPAELPAPPAINPALPTVLIVASNIGTQVTDLLGPYEVLKASGAVNVLVVAHKRELSITTGGMGILPHATFDDAPKADAIIVPTVLDTPNKFILGFVKKRANEVKILASVCEGARVLALAGLLRHKKFTTHFLSAPDFAKLEPTAKPQMKKRVVVDGKILTTAGITGSIDGTLELLARLTDGETARRTAESLGWPGRKGRTQKVEQGEFVRLAMNLAFDWSKRTVGVVLYPGVSELAVAAAMDTFPRTLSTLTYTVADTRELVISKHGLPLVPQFAAASAPAAHLAIIPSHGPDKGTNASIVASSDPKVPGQAPSVHKWIVESQSSTKSFYYEAPGRAYEQSLHLITELYGATVARTSAKLIEYSPGWMKPNRSSPGFPFGMILKPLLLGLLAVLIAWTLKRRFTQNELSRKPIRE